jgi:EAL domain-containing protein (putative c-di-GMP-specific phosphodiesterase class I)
MEISEKDAIENYVLFRSAADYYTDLGFAIAVDDTGSGHSSLETVVELKPQFLKLDISLVRGIHKNIIKQELLRAILSLSRSMNSTVIAEGIETEEELDMLLSLGVSFGQGFLIGKPMAEFVVPQKR